MDWKTILAYVFGILVALPVYVLWAVGAYGIVRALISWMYMPDSPQPPKQKKATLGG